MTVAAQDLDRRSEVFFYDGRLPLSVTHTVSSTWRVITSTFTPAPKLARGSGQTVEE